MLVHAHPVGGRAQSRSRLEVADIVRAHGQDFARTHTLTPKQHAVLRDIARCRTGMLPTAAFHVVFTLPRELRRLTLANRQRVFDLFFR